MTLGVQCWIWKKPNTIVPFIRQDNCKLSYLNHFRGIIYWKDGDNNVFFRIQLIDGCKQPLSVFQRLYSYRKQIHFCEGRLLKKKNQYWSQVKIFNFWKKQNKNKTCILMCGECQPSEYNHCLVKACWFNFSREWALLYLLQDYRLLWPWEDRVSSTFFSVSCTFTTAYWLCFLSCIWRRPSWCNLLHRTDKVLGWGCCSPI